MGHYTHANYFEVIALPGAMLRDVDSLTEQEHIIDAHQWETHDAYVRSADGRVVMLFDWRDDWNERDVKATVREYVRIGLVQRAYVLRMAHA